MNNQPQADVSVIVANYNNGRYLHDFMQGVIASSVTPRELIMVDDGSTDNSIEVLETYRYLDSLKLILFPANQGFTAALNAGLGAARCKYIMRADPDDVILPGRIGEQFRFMEDHPEIEVLGANVIYFNDQTGKKINGSNFPLTHRGIVKAYRRGEHGLLHATVIAKAEVYQSYRYQEIFPSEDYELFSRMVMDGRQFASLSKPVTLVRIHERSSTGNLQLSAIRQTFAFRDQVFHTRTSKPRIWWYFFHISHYRKYQAARNPVLKYLYLFITAMSYPPKAVRRIKQAINSIGTGVLAPGAYRPR
jgi:glycosyltransferase involved in cell wall biosynthesis